MTAIIIPRRASGRQSIEARTLYEADIDAFCAAIIQIRSTLDFEVSARGWAYILEEHGLTKDDFDTCERVINDCRKEGCLPLDIAAVDESRTPDHLEELDDGAPDEQAGYVIDYLDRAHLGYEPVSFWEFQSHYIEMMVEKIDLKSLFKPICAEFHVACANAKGWSDINSRAHMMQRFAKWEAAGKICVLLYCGDHDPAGLQISDTIKKNLFDLERAVGWSPAGLIVKRFGLNADFIEQHRLSWIDNLMTGGKRDLTDPRHPDHRKPYVQNYLAKFGARKVEANALVVRPEAGRALCRAAITNYIERDGIALYQAERAKRQHDMQRAITRLLAERFGVRR
jgi:hypothetical protein